MKYIPTTDMTIETVELINKLGQVLENRLIGKNYCKDYLKDYKYVAFDSNGDLWAYSEYPYIATDNSISWSHHMWCDTWQLHLRFSLSLISKINSTNFKHLLFKLGDKA